MSANIPETFTHSPQTVAWFCQRSFSGDAAFACIPNSRQRRLSGRNYLPYPDSIKDAGHVFGIDKTEQLQPPEEYGLQDYKTIFVSANQSVYFFNRLCFTKK